MSQVSIKFIASDMDGTLLDQYGRLDPEFFDLFLQLEEQGILFSAASGRQYYSLRDTFAPIKDRVLYVAENGTLVMYQDKELYSCTILKRKWRRLCKRLVKLTERTSYCVASALRTSKRMISNHWKSFKSTTTAVKRWRICLRSKTSSSR